MAINSLNLAVTAKHENLSGKGLINNIYEVYILAKMTVNFSANNAKACFFLKLIF
jgi:hypothetical protein